MLFKQASLYKALIMVLSLVLVLKTQVLGVLFLIDNFSKIKFEEKT